MFILKKGCEGSSKSPDPIFKGLALCHRTCMQKKEGFRRRRCIAGAVSATMLASQPSKNKMKRNTQPTFHRIALHFSVCSKHTTAWRQAILCGSSLKFYVCTNVTCHLFSNILIPVFAKERQNYKFGSSYRRGPKRTGRPCTISTNDILGLTLWCLESSGRRRQLSESDLCTCSDFRK